MSKLIKANGDVPEHILLENGVRVVDGVQYGRGKNQVRLDGSVRVVSNTQGLSLTKQSFADEVDIQSIVKKAMAGQLINTNNTPPKFMDVTALPDYQTALNLIIETDNIFNSLDAHKRQFFGNSPQAMLDFLANSQNLPEAVKMGLLDPSAILPAKQAEPAKEAGEAAP